MSAFLKVEASLTGRRWVGLTPDQDRMAQAMAQQTNLPQPLCQTLSRLGVPVNNAKRYLAPTLKELLPDPSVLRDMDLAAERILKAASRASL